MDKLRDAVDKLQTQQPSKQGETPYMRNVTNMVDYVNDQETKAELDQMSARLFDIYVFGNVLCCS